MFLHRSFHDLCLASNSPNSNFSLHASGHDLVARVSQGQGGDSVVVRVIDSVEEFSTLGQEGANLTVGPSGNKAFAVVHEASDEALKAGHFDSQKLLSCLGVPYSDIIHRGGSEKLRVGIGEGDRVDTLEMACVSKLSLQLVGVSPVDCSLACSNENVSEISGR